MKKEIKISLPVYKMVYAICFIIILSLIRGIAYSVEIGIALEAPMAILAIVFCSDTYIMEIASKRAEVNRLYPLRKRVFSQYQRMISQLAFLFILAIIGYGLFMIIQQPICGVLSPDINSTLELQSELYLFFTYMISIIVTISFWGILANVIACLFRNIWGGIGCGLLLWLILNGKTGNMILGKWNIFSYTFRNTLDLNDVSWLCGKGICIGFIILFVVLLPIILKKRG